MDFAVRSRGVEESFVYVKSEEAKYVATRGLLSKPVSEPLGKPPSNLVSEPSSQLVSEPLSKPPSNPMSKLSSELPSNLVIEPASDCRGLVTWISGGMLLGFSLLRQFLLINLIS